ncbi:hypothetical protein SI65_04010 [Aspergillus cristatus]|uniref:Uncharacterized protein n=1 Tax=Aspergillus cristatus TaxID=573508 RepID=A0A1E3BJ74_ASPCR|nr:hypothetical protein SI65_04010 [Aspergillus cristatus]
MTFGYGIGDFIAVLKLANDVRKQFVNAPGHFKALSEEDSVKGFLRDVEDFELETGLPDLKKERLNEIWRDCHEVLNILQGILNKYQEI